MAARLQVPNRRRPRSAAKHPPPAVSKQAIKQELSASHRRDCCKAVASTCTNVVRAESETVSSGKMAIATSSACQTADKRVSRQPNNPNEANYTDENDTDCAASRSTNSPTSFSAALVEAVSQQ